MTIMYFLLDNVINDCHTIRNADISITIFRGNKEYLRQPLLGLRCDRVYLDKHLNTIENRDWIDYQIKPMCTKPDSYIDYI